MSETRYGVILGALLASPFFFSIYPTLWDWMAMPMDEPGARILGLLFFGVLSFGCVFAVVALYAFFRDDKYL